jgi:hypothetical protein
MVDRMQLMAKLVTAKIMVVLLSNSHGYGCSY